MQQSVATRPPSSLRFVLRTDRGEVFDQRFDVLHAIAPNAPAPVQVIRNDDSAWMVWPHYRRWISRMGKRIARKTGRPVQIQFIHRWRGVYVLTVPVFGKGHAVRYTFEDLICGSVQRPAQLHGKPSSGAALAPGASP